MFVCGSGSFGHQDEDEYYSPIATPKKSKRSTSFCKIIGRDNNNKNPYADSGLDKFNELQAYLDDKKQQIYAQMGSDQISYIRFVYTNDSKRIKPIVVGVKEKNKQDLGSPKDTFMSHDARGTKTLPIVTGDVARIYYSKGSEDVQSQVVLNKNGMSNNNKYSRYGGSFSLYDLRQPRNHVIMIIVLILMFLVIFGRFFAILCTSITWYLTSMAGGSSSTSSDKRGPKKLKKEYVKKASEKKHVSSEGPSSPTSVLPYA